jgi:hypothetical protein
MTNTWGYQRSRIQVETAQRIDLGLQCPECFGVRTQLQPRQPHDRHCYQCQECGCEWLRQ